MDVVSVDKQIILQALYSEMSDFEDAIQVFSAKQEAITIIITRNNVDFIKSDLDVHSPESFLHMLQQNYK